MPSPFSKFDELLPLIGFDSKALSYLNKRAKQKLEKMGGDFAAKEALINSLETVNKHADQAVFDTSRIWNGEPYRSVNPTLVIQESIAAESIAHIKSDISDNEILHDFAIDEDGHYLRAFSQDGQALNEERETDLDKLFNLWLAEQGFISQDSTIYLQDNKGELLKDKNGQSVKADPEVIKDKLKDSQNSFKNFMSKKDIKLKTKQHRHPGIRAEATEAQATTRTEQNVRNEETPSQSQGPGRQA
jgi:phosphopantetheinyl transferase (holo-ACP synthase)